MNDNQIENWRKVLSLSIGPYAFLIPREEIERIRGNFQREVDSLEKKMCDCDASHHGFTRHMDDSVTCNNCGRPRKVIDA